MKSTRTSKIKVAIAAVVLLLVLPATIGLLRIFSMPAAAALSSVQVAVHSTPGANLQAIFDRMLADETPASHSDLLIVQGGLNDAHYGTDANALRTYWEHGLAAFSQHAHRLEIPLFIAEVTPILPEALDQRGEKGHPYYERILIENEELHRLAKSLDFIVIPTFAEFSKHFNNDKPDAWCRNPANAQIVDGVHLSEHGTEALGGAFWSGIAGTVRSMRERPVRVAIYGDSITAAEYLPQEKHPAHWLEEKSKIKPGFFARLFDR